VSRETTPNRTTYTRPVTRESSLVRGTYTYSQTSFPTLPVSQSQPTIMTMSQIEALSASPTMAMPIVPYDVLARLNTSDPVIVKESVVSRAPEAASQTSISSPPVASPPHPVSSSVTSLELSEQASADSGLKGAYNLPPKPAAEEKQEDRGMLQYVPPEAHVMSED